MRYLLLTTTILFALAGCTSARADDAYNWTGLYFGGVGSYSWTGVEYPDAPAHPVGPPRPDFEGGLLGATAGYNVQVGHVVVGVEGDYSFGNLGSTERDGNYLTQTYDIDALATIRGRLGFAMGSFLPFITAGVAFERLELGAQCPTTTPDAPTFCAKTGPFDFRSKEWNTGYVIGGGLEWQASKAISLKGEVLYTDYGKETYSLGGGAPFDIERDETLIRFGANFRFN